jgi:hypothetical protein
VPNEKTRGGVSNLLDGLVLNRLRGAVDRRLDWRIKKRLSDEKQIARLMSTTAARDAVAAEVARQTVAVPAGGADRDFTLSVLFGARTGIKRWFSQAQYKRLVREVKDITGAASVDMPITQAFRSLLDAESRGLGRIAGGPCNILGKLVVPALLEMPDGAVLEIGTLYGLFSPTLLRSIGRSGRFRDLTVIDPFTGRQMQGGENLKVDLSQTPVVEEVARWNFHELGLADDRVRIINGFSTDDAIKAAAGDRKYALVVIDGDHFEQGVAHDLAWVETILAPGGLAILDDYGDPKWPGVEAATQKYLAGDPKMTMLGTVWTSGYLRMPWDS